MRWSQLDTDVIVVGSEAAGGYAAVKAYDNGAKVIVITKNIAGKSGVTAILTGNMIAALGPEDSPEIHFRDTIIGGRFLNDQKLVMAMCREAPNRVRELDRWGLPFEKKDGKIVLTEGGGHTYNRRFGARGRLGSSLSMCLMRQMQKRGIKIINDMFVTSYLTTSEGRITGATAIDLKKGEFVVIRAKALVTATGGAHRLYWVNDGGREATGDGMAMAFRVGAKLIDMEFIQFYPTVIVAPEYLKGEQHLVAGATRWGKLYNVLEENIEVKGLRDEKAKAIYKEIQEGRGTPHGGVWVDMLHRPWEERDKIFQNRCPNYRHEGINMLEWGLDLRKIRLEVAPGVHFFCGGIKVNEKWASNVPGLFAAGECVGAVHGANRLNSNAVTDCVVSGGIAGKSAAEYVKCIESLEIDEEQVDAEYRRVHEHIRIKEVGIRPPEAIETLQKIMDNYVGVYRDEDRLKTGLEKIAIIKEVILPKLTPATRRRMYNYDWIEILELYNMIELGEIIARAALERKEIRGNHIRIDYSETSKKWLKHIVVASKEGKLTMTTIPVKSIYMELEG